MKNKRETKILKTRKTNKIKISANLLYKNVFKSKTKYAN